MVPSTRPTCAPSLSPAAEGVSCVWVRCCAPALLRYCAVLTTLHLLGTCHLPVQVVCVATILRGLVADSSEARHSTLEHSSPSIPLSSIPLSSIAPFPGHPRRASFVVYTAKLLCSS